MAIGDLYKETVDPNLGVNKIIDDEAARITLKETKVNMEYETKKRQDSLIDNQTARRNAYTFMLLVGFVTVIVVVLIIVLVRFFPGGILSNFADLFTTTIISLAVIYLIVLYVDIQRRDLNDYNKIGLGFLWEIPSDPTNSKNIKVTSLASDTVTKLCVGKECCPTKIFAGNKCEGFSPQPEYTML